MSPLINSPMGSNPIIQNIDLQSFREALSVLQRQVDELDELKASHYQEIVEHEEEVWDFVQGKVSSINRSCSDKKPNILISYSVSRLPLLSGLL